jgi:hypothetical protein
MAIKIKTIKGRGYWYEDKTTRVNGKPVTKSTYIAPVHPRRRRGIGLGTLVANLLAGGAAFGGHALKGTLGPPGGRKYKEKAGRSPDPRSLPTAQELYEIRVRAYERWQQTGKMVLPSLKGEAKAQHAPIVVDDKKREMLDMLHAFNERRREDAMRHAAPKAPPASAAPQAPAAPAPASQPAGQQAGEQPADAPSSSSSPSAS